MTLDPAQPAPVAPADTGCPRCGNACDFEGLVGIPCWHCQGDGAQRTPSKPFTGCREIKPTAEFYRDRSKRDGMSCRCKSCISEDQRSRYAARPVAIISTLAPSRTCSKCRTQQPASQFGPTKKGLFHSHCRTCRNTAKREHYARNREAIRAKVRAAYAANIDASRERCREASRKAEAKEATRRGRQTEHGRLQHSKRNRAYRRRHPEREAARSATKYAIRKGRIARPDHCEVLGCNRPAVHAHHHDYRPLEVAHLCGPHHAGVHRLGFVPLKAGSVAIAPPKTTEAGHDPHSA
jgi:hypothetical protein